MLTLSGIVKTFGSRRVLDGLDLHIAAGESLALVGANGCGKTTTLRLIVGLARPDRGSISVAGADAARRPLAARGRLSYLPQRPVFPSTLTVRETLEIVARLRRLGQREVDREIEACGLSTVAGSNVGQLSGGERQRLGIAVALLPAVDLYLFDEPSANLDPASSRMLFRRARELQREGRTLLFTTHVPADVRHLATRVARLSDGRIASDGSGAFEVRRYERLLEREIWGDVSRSPAEVDDESICGDRGSVCAGDRLLEPIARAGAAAGR